MAKMKQKPAAKKSSVAKSKSTGRAKKQADIIQLIMEDHKPLKRLIKVLKKPENSFDMRMKAFTEFAELLVNHAKPEELSLYVNMKQDEDMRSEALEGDVEHGLADQLLEEIKRTEDEDMWTAKVKVLAELVEHHIEEEEEELLPDYRKNSEIDERIELGQKYLDLKTKMAEEGNDDAPSEKTMKSTEFRPQH